MNEKQKETKNKINPSAYLTFLQKYFCQIKFILYHFRKNLSIPNFNYIFSLLLHLKLYLCCLSDMWKRSLSLADSISIGLSREDFKTIQNSYSFIPCPIDTVYSTRPYLCLRCYEISIHFDTAELKVNLWDRNDITDFSNNISSSPVDSLF